MNAMTIVLLVLLLAGFICNFVGPAVLWDIAVFIILLLMILGPLVLR